MPPPLVVSVFLCVSLPMAPWASRISYDLVPETEYRTPHLLADSYTDVRAGSDFGRSYGAGLPGAGDEPDGLTEALEVGSDSRLRFLSLDESASRIPESAGGGQKQGAGGMGMVKPGEPAVRWLRIAQRDMASGDAIGWSTLELGSGLEQLALCLIGLFAMAPSVLRRRGAMGGRGGRRSRRQHTRRSPTS